MKRFPLRLILAGSAVLLPTFAHLVAAQEISPRVSGSSCSAVPKFAKERGISSPVFSTVDRFKSGITMHQQMPGSQLGPALQLPSWTRAGRLGAFVVTETGDIFVIPVPSVNTLQNSFPLQNTLYRITNAEGTLEEFLKFPVSTSPSQSNPYGLVGLTYDCDSQILYAASVSGSTRVSEKGSVFALSSRSAQVVARLDDIDVLGLVVAKTARGKELLLGSARDARVLRVSLDRAGAFVGRPTLAFTFDEADELRARKLKYQGGELFVFATEFYYNLVALSEFKQPTFRFRYEESPDTWDLMEVASPDIIDFPIEGTR